MLHEQHSAMMVEVSDGFSVSSKVLMKLILEIVRMKACRRQFT